MHGWNTASKYTLRVIWLKTDSVWVDRNLTLHVCSLQCSLYTKLKFHPHFCKPSWNRTASSTKRCSDTKMHGNCSMNLKRSRFQSTERCLTLHTLLKEFQSWLLLTIAGRRHSSRWPGGGLQLAGFEPPPTRSHESQPASRVVCAVPA